MLIGTLAVVVVAALLYSKHLTVGGLRKCLEWPFSSVFFLTAYTNEETVTYTQDLDKI